MLLLNKKYHETVARRIKKLLKGDPTVVDASQDTFTSINQYSASFGNHANLRLMSEMEPPNAFLKLVQDFLSRAKVFGKFFNKCSANVYDTVGLIKIGYSLLIFS